MSNRFLYCLGFATVFAVLVTSLYFQFFKGIIPCPLCTLQRLSFALLGGLFLIGIPLSAKRWATKLLAVLTGLVSCAGLLLSGRQVWLQQFHSADASECGVSLQYMLQVLPLNEVMAKVFSGSAECAQPGANFLSLDMAAWAFIFFSGFLLMSLYLLLRRDIR